MATTRTHMAHTKTTTRRRRGIALQPLNAALLPDALLTLKTASAVSGLSEATIYRKAASDPTFPRLVKMGSRCTRIRAGSLTTWLAAQAAATSALLPQGSSDGSAARTAEGGPA